MRETERCNGTTLSLEMVADALLGTILYTGRLNAGQPPKNVGEWLDGMISSWAMATTRQWLMKLADVLERRSTLRWGDHASEMITDTPLGTILYLVAAIPPAERERVYAALPVVATEDFQEATRLIRSAAGEGQP